MAGKHGGRGRHRWLTVTLAVSVSVAVIAGGAALAAYRFDVDQASRILPGVTIAGVDVGGMTREQAQRALLGVTSAILYRQILVQAAGRTWGVSPKDLGTSVDAETAIDQAFALADRLSWTDRVYHRLLSRPIPTSLKITVSYDQATVVAFGQRIAREVAVTASNATFDVVDGRVVTTKARTGRVLKTGVAQAAILAAVRGDQALVDLPVKVIKPGVSNADLGMTIVIRLSVNRLYLYDGTRLVKSYPVATGQLGVFDTPQGHFVIVNKRINPSWHNPAPDGWGAGEPLVIPPGPDNPLGTRALDLSAPGIRIHGTPDDASIGHWASHGCIRMHIPDSVDLFDRVEVGTPVIIVW